MCRMLLAVGKFEMKPLLEGLAIMAADKNERHEENENVLFQHADGWGIVYRENNELKIYKSTKPCFEDPGLYDFEKLESPFVVLHARRASKGEVIFENVHPFGYQMADILSAFFHNGTVYQDLPIDSRFKPRGSTDSELFYYYLLSQINWELLPDSYLAALRAINDYSSINSMFCLRDRLLLLNQYKINPLYYTMKITQDDHATLVSSEVLPTLPAHSWKKIENGTLLDFQLFENEWQTTFLKL